MRLPIIALFFAFLCIGTIAAGPGLADSEFELAFDDTVETVDVPPQEITIEGDTFTVSTVGQVNPGEEIVVKATPPSDEDYTLYLYTSDDGDPYAEDFDRGEGPGTDPFSFETAELDPGSYTVVLDHDGRFETIAPVTIAAYEFDSVDAPTNAEPGESLEISVTLSEIESEPIERVEVVVWNGNSRETFRMTEDAALEYSTTIDGLDEGEYDVYLNVRGTEEVYGTNQKELLAVSEGPSISVEAEETSGGDSGGTGGSGGGAAPGDDETDEETPTPDDTETPTPTPEGDQTQTATPDDGETPTQTPETTETETETPDSTPTEGSDDDGPITPNVDTPQPEEQPGFGAFLAGGALVIALRLLDRC